MNDESQNIIWGYFFCKLLSLSYSNKTRIIMDKDWNDVFRRRTKQLAVALIKYYGQLNKSDEIRIIGKQLIRSATSAAANYRAVIRARSDAEKFSQLCIVVEEADETLFWLEILEECQFSRKEDLASLKSEATEIVKVMASYRGRFKRK